MWAIGCIMGELTDGQPLFPGENEFDQLCVIQKVLGPLAPEHMEMFQKHPRFLGTRFPEYPKPETLEKKYLGKLSKKALSFIKSILRMDTKERLTAASALQHPYFEGLSDLTINEISQKNRSDSAKPVFLAKEIITQVEIYAERLSPNFQLRDRLRHSM